MWRHLAWQLVPEAFVGAPGATDDTPLPDPSQAALLALVRARPDDAAALLEEARSTADAADNQAMLTAVAHAARAAGVEFKPHTF